jgi:hypothetical protein
MPAGPGKYDAACTVARLTTKATGAVLIVLDGVHGSGFSCQMPYELSLTLPTMLRHMADEVEASLKQGDA